MKLTMEEVELKMAAAWGKQAFVIPYRLAGNRYSYVVSDHEEQQSRARARCVPARARRRSSPRSPIRPSIRTPFVR